MRAAEAKLDAFWTKVDQIMHQPKFDFSDTVIGKLLAHPRVLERTLERQEPVKPEASSSRHVDDIISPFSDMHISRNEETISNNSHFDKQQVKEKIKTHGTTDVTNQKKQQTEAKLPNPVAQLAPIHVDPRTFKVLQTLFYTSSTTATPGEIPWKEFLHAMTSIGFQAEKLYGSAWQFTPTTLDVERGIMFHEPHPIAKIRFFTARNFKRRLNRAYGWSGGSFVLKEKKEGSANADVDA